MYKEIATFCLTIEIPSSFVYQMQFTLIICLLRFTAFMAYHLIMAFIQTFLNGKAALDYTIRGGET